MVIKSMFIILVGELVMIDYNSMHPSIEVDNLPEEALDEVYEFYDKINKKYCGKRIDDDLKTRLNQDVISFNRLIQVKYGLDYQKEKPTVKLTGNLAYHETIWVIKDILHEHKKHCREKHTEKQEYTRIEVNNMLFDLHIIDRIRKYSCVALPYDIGRDYNNKIFPSDETVYVECRY